MSHEEKLQYVELLKRKLCEVTRCEALSPSDFVKMVAYVNDKTKDTIGLSTLKRLYGYGGAKTRPRNSTLDSMAKTIGYNLFSAFCDHYKSQATNLSSEDVLQPHISSDSLVVGQQLRICWNPGREIIVGYMGNNTYRVVRSQNSKLHVLHHRPWLAPLQRHHWKPVLRPIRDWQTRRPHCSGTVERKINLITNKKR